MPSAPVVIISQTTSSDPAKREFQEQLAATLTSEVGVAVWLIPHVYDLKSHGPSLTALRQLDGDLIVLSWLYPRGTHWTLDRHGVRGRLGRTRTVAADGEPQVDASSADEPERHVFDLPTTPDRAVYCLDLRDYSTAEPIVAEVRRIVAERGPRTPVAATGIAPEGRPTGIVAEHGLRTPLEHAPAVQRIEEPAARRWYPVIDFSRCTNCMECIDFCLFGVYGVDQAEQILVEQPDNCRKGCPACSRVCPTSAIIFPQHKTPGIAGAPGEASDWKLDLSDLFGGRPPAEGPRELAAQERQNHLALARSAAAPASDESPPQQDRPQIQTPDELDRLLDQVEGLDL